MDKKKWWQSRTIWVNGLTALAAIGTAIAKPDIISDPNIIKYIGAGIAIVNIFLRLITDKGISNQNKISS